jgi:hypothetical protein
MKGTIRENKVFPHRTTKCYELEDTHELPMMLDIRAITRDAIAMPYSYLEMIQYDPSVALVLTFSACEVRIEGRNLAELYAALTEHKVNYIQENDAKYDEVPEESPFIERIEITPLGRDLQLLVKGFDSERESLVERQSENETVEPE